MLLPKKEERATLQQVLNHTWTKMSEDQLAATEVEALVIQPSKKQRYNPSDSKKQDDE